MRAALIDYGSGNLASAAKALARAANSTGHEIVTTADPEIVRMPSASCCPAWAPLPIA
jgi:glutamine amidotransferase